jgi:hypothetical protein
MQIPDGVAAVRCQKPLKRRAIGPDGWIRDGRARMNRETGEPLDCRREPTK